MRTDAPDIFISYAREDEAWVRPLAAELERRGRSVFWDRRIPAGKDWRSHIGAALERARCVVVVWSRHSLSSKFVLEEADEGKERDVLLPVFRHPVRPPLGFRGIHAADLSDWSPGEAAPAFETFMADLADVLGPVPETGCGEDGAAESEAERPAPGEPEAVLSSPLTPEIPPSPRAAGLAENTLPEPPARGVGRPLMIAAGVLAVGGLALDLYTDGSPESEQPTVATATPAPGKTFTDTLADGSPCPFCPEMVVVPAGSFTMNSPSPQREVTFAQPFAIGRYEVTFDEWDACVAAGSCNGYKPADEGWGRGWRPVIHVSWGDARAYAAWLAKKTGGAYRLPTEAEWEYAARAGEATPANLRQLQLRAQGAGRVYPKQTVAVNDPAFPANPFGLYHVHGNVWEWVQDCYREYYYNNVWVWVQDLVWARSDGRRAVEGSACPWRVLRGGSWHYGPPASRALDRYRVEPAVRDDFVGFRVARTINP